MCGICGIIKLNGIESSDRVAFSKMLSSLNHRGPDGEGVFESDKLICGMRRLSIIDLTGGWQPLYNEDNSISLIANGEIYNYVELTEDLSKKHLFKTKSDCETIIHAYEEYGDEFVKKLRGMFAFALYDKNKNLLILCRDRVGEKPLYIYETVGELLFASELRTILSSSKIPFEVNFDAINEYFHFAYVPDPKTPIKNVHKLEPGHFMKIDLTSLTISKTKYWDLIDDSQNSSENPEKLVKDSIYEVSSIITRSDVPVGIALSGGFDSGALAACVAKNSTTKLSAFTVGYYGRPKSDERLIAGKLAKTLNIEFNEIELNTSQIIDDFPQIVSSCDDPIADISSIGYYYVMKEARKKGVYVMLQGQGGDELFWGYDWVRKAVKISEQKKKFIEGNYNPNFLDYLNTEVFPFGVKGFFRTLKSGFSNGYMKYLNYFKDDNLIFYELSWQYALFDSKSKHLFSDDFYSFYNPVKWVSPSLKEIERVDLQINKLLYQTYLLENGLAQGDRLSMASSVELRLPLVDYILIERVIGARKNKSDVQLGHKYWVKKALSDLLPDFILNKPKQGFEPPVVEWTNALFDKYGSILDNGRLVELGILKKDAFSKIINKSNIVQNRDIFFELVVLEIWFDTLIRSIFDKN